MKKRNLFLGAAAMLLTALFSACSSDDPVPGTGQEDPVDDGGKVYMNIDITSTTANGSRSTTTDQDDPNVSSDDTEEGQDYENKISNIMVAIVGTKKNGVNTEDGCFIAKWTKTFDAGNEMGIGGAGTNIQAEFDRTNFLTHYASHSGQTGLENVRVYVICNYDNTINDKVGQAGASGQLKWISAPVDDTEKKGIISNFVNNKLVSYSDQNKILMTNYKVYDTTIPTQADIEGNKYNSPSDAYSLTANHGPVLVERAVARFDYAPYVNAGVTGANVQLGSNNDVYYVLAQAQAADADKGISAQPEIQVRLTRMSLVNMSKSFYLFRRVSDDGTPDGDNFAIGGREVDDGAATNPYVNYVVDPEYQFKKTFTSTTSHEQFTDRFHYWVNAYDEADDGTIVNAAWDGQSIRELIGNAEIKDGVYHTFRYVTPNTIPGIETQKAGISTGIVFKAKISAKDNSEIGIGGTMKKHYDIFAFGGKLIGSWDDVKAAATATNPTDQDLVVAYNEAIGADTSLKDWTINDDTNKGQLTKEQTAAVVKVGFAKYGYVVNGGHGAGDGYFCYYYYWNRHNDNANSGERGPMEFGVVRNNVYKLAVTSIKRLGHPFRKDNDPDPVKPEDPDEESKLYMTVSVKVMPWTKRVNHIVF